MNEVGRRPGAGPELSLRDAMRAARIEAAERAGVVVELRDAELARLAMLNEVLEPVFADLPAEHADLFDRGLMPGETPRLFVDMIAHIAMGRDKRTYRFLQDTRAGRRVLAESANPADMADAVTRYIARRLVAREQAMAGLAAEREDIAPLPLPKSAGRRSLGARLADEAAAPAQRSSFTTFLAGVAAGMVALLVLGLVLTQK
ncbi:MAG TPA: hypothetical protein VLA00_10500 [Xanthobacteraceae bacterium]|nr:hypothetical protein [Xanthobacteraceae bacterium]